MPLAMEGTRVLSPLERDAVKSVFQDTIDPWDIELEIVEFIDREDQEAKYINFEAHDGVTVAVSAYYGNGKIRINKSAFPYTQALNINSTRRYLDLTDKNGELTNRFRPGNMHYLSTLIHECTHYWEEVFDRYAGGVFNKPAVYRFNKEQLRRRDVPDLSPEQHASAAQICFLIEWQLEQQPKGSDVYLTSRSKNPKLNVGPVGRFQRIDFLALNLDENEVPQSARIFTYEKARGWIGDYFGWLLVELRYGWKAVCQGKEPFSKVTGG